MTTPTCNTHMILLLLLSILHVIQFNSNCTYLPDYITVWLSRQLKDLATSFSALELTPTIEIFKTNA